ncbi:MULTISPECIES: hypothetical protein [unclassified Paenibacillus]|uniref:hypothetical protein n=1 Tax=unclassified Paenibacillus TaxID=185978 RepID=UPI0015E3E2E2|nr:MULTISPECIES: hypothetical protein [unclassified Paenibacillus]QZN73431.1 hypothetical protein K5K90_18460 [Paenibacillus sp. DR312]
MSFVFYPEMVIFILMLILLIIGIVYIRRTLILYKKHPEKTRLLHANENEEGHGIT